MLVLDEKYTTLESKVQILETKNLKLEAEVNPLREKNQRLEQRIQEEAAKSKGEGHLDETGVKRNAQQYARGVG